MLVEDEVVEQMLLQRAFKGLNITRPLQVASTGEEAFEILRAGKNEKPCIIMLDMNLPKMNGLEFLKAVKQDESLRMIPVIMLSTSKEKKDVEESFRCGAAGYMAKPIDYGHFLEMIRAIDLYWTLSELPE